MACTDWPNCVGTWKSNVTYYTSQMFEETFIKIFFKSVIGSNKESKKILKDLYSALKSESSSEPEFTRKPFIDHNSGRDVFPGQVEVSNEWTNQMLYKCLIITVLQENL